MPALKKDPSIEEVMANELMEEKGVNSFSHQVIKY